LRPPRRGIANRRTGAGLGSPAWRTLQRRRPPPRRAGPGPWSSTAPPSRITGARS